MKQLILFLLIGASFIGCSRRNDEVWDDTKTCGRHVAKGFRSLGGKQGDSRAVCSRDQFMRSNQDLGFVPLPDEEFGGDLAMADVQFAAKDPDPSIPGIEGFRDPSKDPATRNIFSHIHFDLNSNLIKGKENLDTCRKIADYMMSNPKAYVYVEGHCDERGAESYNLALGSRRANAVRAQLIKDGADPDRLYTVSYGKERPLVNGVDEQSWALNRRSEFKLYTR